MVAIVEELHLPLLPGQVRAVLLEIVLHGAAAVLSVLQPPVELQHTLLLRYQVPFHLLQGNETPLGFAPVSAPNTSSAPTLSVQHLGASQALQDTHTTWKRWSSEA